MSDKKLNDIRFQALGNLSQSSLKAIRLLFFKIDALETVLKKHKPELDNEYQKELKTILEKNIKIFEKRH